MVDIISVAGFAPASGRIRLKTGQHPLIQKNILRTKNKSGTLFLTWWQHSVAAGWMTATTVLPVRQFQS
jgi:hypothetical protein